MSQIGGSLESVTLDGRTFPVAADSDSNRKLGGFENEVQVNGDGTGRIIKTRVPLSISGITIGIDDANGDHEFLQALANRNSEFSLGVTYASGETYQGAGQLVGEMQVSSQNATAAIELMGSGVLTKQ